MVIKKDAGELLLLFYQNEIEEKKQPSLTDLLIITKWQPNRLKLALEYLVNKNLIKVIRSLGNYRGIPNMIIQQITERGIDIIENEKEFQKTFSFAINLGIVSFSWEVTKK